MKGSIIGRFGEKICLICCRWIAGFSEELSVKVLTEETGYNKVISCFCPLHVMQLNKSVMLQNEF